GGSGRWDIRGAGAALTTLSPDYVLTKTGGNQVSFVGVAVDPTLGDIDIQGGLLGFETTTTSMGNPASNLTVRAGAQLSLFNSTNRWTKMFTLFGDGITASITNWSGSNTLAGPITLNGSSVIGVNTNSV